MSKPKKFPCEVTAIYAGTYRTKYKEPGTKFTCHTSKEYSQRWMAPGKQDVPVETPQMEPKTLKDVQASRAGESSPDDQGAGAPEEKTPI